MSKVSILHISDLHKDDDDDYGNLLSSLVTDIDYCKDNKGINKPDIIVVSGDIIRGATGDNSDEEIKRQYAQVKVFLESLVDVFLDGDKSRIVIVPGNHDIDREVSKKSMRIINVDNIDEKRKLLNQILEDSSTLRWSWSDFSFYEIFDLEEYNKRFENFIRFFNEFYNGCHILINDPKEQSLIFNYDKYKIAFIGFNSCYNLDHLNTSGKIYPTALTRLDGELKNIYNQGTLLVGVWHHHTNGYPNESNYLDKRILSAMIDRHIYLGLHGHQHISSIANEFKNTINGKSLYLISAGTLYGGRKELPYRAGRQYNIIEIEHNNDVVITVHSREDISRSLFAIPSFQDGKIDSGSDSYLQFKLPKPPQSEITTIIDRILRDTEDLAIICDKLSELDTENFIVRKFLLDSLQKMNAYERICTVFIHPKNINEAVALLEAVNELNDETKAREVLLDVFINNSKDASVQFLKDHVRRIIKNK